jgi:hypothetical protein
VSGIDCVVASYADGAILRDSLAKMGKAKDRGVSGAVQNSESSFVMKLTHQS